MDAKAVLLHAWEREPHKAFSTTALVELLYPQHMKTIREQLQYGSREQKKSSQVLKSKLHRKTLYYIAKLVEEQVLAIGKVDAHGEKWYQLASSTAVVQTPTSTIQLAQHTPRTHYIEKELDSKAAHLIDTNNTLYRVDSVYIHCGRIEGLGQLNQMLDTTLRGVHDVVCLGEFQALLQRYQQEDLEEFIHALTVHTLDEARSVCILLDTRNTIVAPFARLLAEILPKRIYVVFVCDRKSIANKDTLQCIQYLQDRHEKVNVHFAPNHAGPIFVGKAGVYGLQDDDWQRFIQNTKLVGCVVAQASIALDLKRLANEPAHSIRQSIHNAAKALFSIASQQHALGTANHTLKAMHAQPDELFASASVYIRFWNYDWESSSSIISSCRETLAHFAKTQQTVYRACGLPFHFNIQLSSAFSKYHRELSGRSYRKWTINGTADIDSAAFKEYAEHRQSYMESFNGIDRCRVFRGGNPSAEHVAKEVLAIANYGFPLITIDFKPLQGVRRLTEYFG